MSLLDHPFVLAALSLYLLVGAILATVNRAFDREMSGAATELKDIGIWLFVLVGWLPYIVYKLGKIFCICVLPIFLRALAPRSLRGR